MITTPNSPLHFSLSELSKIQRSWASLLPGGSAEPQDGRLTEVTGFGANPGALRMWCYVPPGLPPHAPLVVALHGCGQTANGFNAGTGWSTLADRHGFAVLFPEQVRGNNPNTCFNWFEPEDTTRGHGEVASIAAMVAAMRQRHHHDPRRVFVTGLSAGGAMTATLLATYPDVFAAGAIIAGLPFGAAANVKEALDAMYHSPSRPAAEWGALVRAASPAPQRRPVVSIWQGDADHTVVPRNALELAKQWCDVNGLAEPDGVEDHVDGVLHRSWRDNSGMVRVELFVIPGLAHGVPINPAAGGDRGVGQAMPFILDASVSSTWRIAQSWGLLRADSKPAAAKPAAAEAGVPAAIAKLLQKLGL